MSIPTSLDQLQIESYVESTVVAGQPGIVALNADGTAISGGGGGGGGDVNLTQVNSVAVDIGIGAAGLGTQRVAVANNSSIIIAAGSAQIGHLEANQSVNTAQLGGVAITLGEGALTGGTQRVTLATDSAAVTDLDTLASWDETARAKVNLIAGQAGVTGGAGAVAANTPRITLASDDPAVTALQIIDDPVDSANAVQMTVVKPLAVATYCPDTDTSAAAEASSVSKAAPGVLYGFSFSNANNSTRYLQFFNAVALPADTAVPVLVLACAANSTIAGEWPKGRYFSTGICWCNSTSQNTKTIGAADSLADISYK